MKKALDMGDRVIALMISSGMLGKRISSLIKGNRKMGIIRIKGPIPRDEVMD